MWRCSREIGSQSRERRDARISNSTARVKGGWPSGQFSVVASLFYGTEKPEKWGICSKIVQIAQDFDTWSCTTILLVQKAPHLTHLPGSVFLTEQQPAGLAGLPLIRAGRESACSRRSTWRKTPPCLDQSARGRHESEMLQPSCFSCSQWRRLPARRRCRRSTAGRPTFSPPSVTGPSLTGPPSGSPTGGNRNLLSPTLSPPLESEPPFGTTGSDGTGRIGSP